MNATHIVVLIAVAGAANRIAAAAEPTVSFKYEPSQPTAGHSVVFETVPVPGDAGGTLCCEWDFGDHSLAWTTAPSWRHVYREPGRYVVALSVTGLHGRAETAAKEVDVRGRAFMITFDDGPAAESTPYILEQLSRIGKADGIPVKAGFFLVGEDKSQTALRDIWQPKYGLDHRPGVTSHPDLVRRIAKEGHTVAIHTQHHPDLDRLKQDHVERELRDCYQTICDAGVTPLKIFRPPRMREPKTLPPALEGQWRIVRGDLSKDYLPWATEEDVIEICRRCIRTAPALPVVLTFHDFRGMSGHRLDFVRIVNTLTQNDGFTLIDFAADAAVAASRYRSPKRQTWEDLRDLWRIWQRRLLSDHSP